MLSSSSCVSIACLMWQDGKTYVTLGPAHEVDPGEIAAFDGMLETPNRIVIVSTVEREKLLETIVPKTSTRLRVWINRPKEPDKVIIGLE